MTVTESGCTLGTTAPTPNVGTLPTITRACAVSLMASDIPSATDSCGAHISATTSDPLTYDAAGTYTIHWTYTDGAGNIATQEQTVTVTPDTLAPVPDAASLPTLTGECSVTVATTPTATDNCAGSDLAGTTTDPLTYNTPGTYTVHWKFTDAAGNITPQNQTVIVSDGAAPVPDVASLPTLTDECSVTVTPPTATDNCAGIVTATTTNPTTYTAQGTYTIVWTYTDAASNTTTQNQTVIVDDITAPTITAPAAVSVNADPVSCAVSGVALGSATANDNCTVTVTNNAPASFPLGATTVIWTATDGAGNTATATQVVNVVDVTAPVITRTGAATMTVECHTSFADPGATAADACDSIVPVNASGSVNVNVPGTYTITYTASDDSGNAAAPITRTVNVVDTTPPVMSCPANIVVSLPLNSTATSMAVSYAAATATDSCGGTLPVTYSTASGSVFNVGTMSVTASATDAAGNTASCTFTVTVLYNFTGFFSPVSNLPTINNVNAGRGVPVKFSLSGNKGLGIMAAGYPASQQIACNTSAPISELEGTETSGGSTLSYSPDQYHYNWKTENSWAGTCRVLIIKLNDGTEHTAHFKFK
ncbi:MAG: PxKF domain-containing protein [Acidobacteria bacterium]|nr:PxKF domain-containing protein [Acidobacteriota bacterium]